MIGPQHPVSQLLHEAPPEARRRYGEQRGNARRRGIDWQLTQEQWWQIWLSSGKWPSRGRLRGQYCMSRIGDSGPYAVGNVFIQRREENDRQREYGRPNLHGFQKGYMPPSQKLSVLEVQAIIACLVCGVRGCTLARIFRVAESTISSIKRGHNWKRIG